MSEAERLAVLRERSARDFPRHSPPHFEYEGEQTFIITAACFEHQPFIGKTAQRMAKAEAELIEICVALSNILYAWCILPNHYHLLVRTERIEDLLRALGKFHGSSSFRWNGEDNERGRKVWFRAVERSMRSNRHFYASLNYIHNNPVKHGYVEKWQDWPYSSATEYLAKVGKDIAAEVWREYPVLDYGKDWDPD